MTFSRRAGSRPVEPGGSSLPTTFITVSLHMQRSGLFPSLPPPREVSVILFTGNCCAPSFSLRPPRRHPFSCFFSPNSLAALVANGKESELCVSLSIFARLASPSPCLLHFSPVAYPSNVLSGRNRLCADPMFLRRALIWPTIFDGNPLAPRKILPVV